MRRALVLSTLLLGSCYNDVCSSGGGCIDLRVDSIDPMVTRVDQLELRVLGVAMFSGKTMKLSSAVPLPVTTEISLPNNPSGALAVAVNGFVAGSIVGEGVRATTVKPGQRQSLTVKLSSKPPRRVFVLSPRNGALGGQTAADKACSMAAQGASLSGTYTALLGYANVVGPSKTVKLDDGDRQVILPDGLIVSSDIGFLQPDHFSPINEDANKQLASADCVWTNFAASGTPLGADCSGWTSKEVGQRGNFGFVEKADVNWADFGGNHTCDALCHVYCIEQ